MFSGSGGRTSISNLSPEAFSWLALVLLKLEVSPNVRMVSLQGPDGGRDSVLEGPCVTTRYAWRGYWVFQFKHYTADPARIRGRIIAEYERGVSQVCSLPGHRVDNYILITSVPFTGPPRTGLFDKFAEVKRRLSAQFSVRLDLWDGLEVEALLLKYPRLLSRLRPDLERNTSAEGPPASAILLSGHGERDLTDAQVHSMVRGIVGDLPNPLSPASDSWLWRAYLKSDNLTGRSVISGIARAVARRLPKMPELVPDLQWLRLAWAATEARLGSPRVAARLATMVLKSDPPPSARTWALNICSIAAGKLDQAGSYARFSDAAVQSSLESADPWLSATIKLRMLHKQSWSLGESSNPMQLAKFEDEVAVIVGGSRFMLPIEADHIAAQVDAYTGLELTWHPDQWMAAERSINSAEARFAELNDHSELARMRSERGRLYLLSDSDSTKVIGALSSGVRQRLRQGELTRARYDLLWLGQAHSRAGSNIMAETCWCLGMTIHRQIYGLRRVDTGIVKSLDRSLLECQGELHRMASSRRLTREYLLGLVSSCLLLSETELSYLIDVERFQAFLSERFA